FQTRPPPALKTHTPEPALFLHNSAKPSHLPLPNALPVQNWRFSARPTLRFQAPPPHSPTATCPTRSGTRDRSGVSPSARFDLVLSSNRASKTGFAVCECLAATTVQSRDAGLKQKRNACARSSRDLRSL